MYCILLVGEIIISVLGDEFLPKKPPQIKSFLPGAPILIPRIFLVHLFFYSNSSPEGHIFTMDILLLRLFSFCAFI